MGGRGGVVPLIRETHDRGGQYDHLQLVETQIPTCHQPTLCTYRIIGVHSFAIQIGCDTKRYSLVPNKQTPFLDPQYQHGVMY